MKKLMTLALVLVATGAYAQYDDSYTAPPFSGGTLTEALCAPNGTAAAPSYSFCNDTDTGLFRIGDEQIGIAVGGVRRSEYYFDGEGVYLSSYSSYTDASNYEGFRFGYQNGAFNISGYTAGTGTDNISIQLTPSGTGTVQVGNDLIASSADLTLGTDANPWSDLYLYSSGVGGAIVFEGTTADGFETTLTVADPTTPDKTITLPNLTGTVLLGAATNTGAWATTIDSETSLSLTSHGNVYISADDELNNTGTLELRGGVVTIAAFQSAGSSSLYLNWPTPAGENILTLPDVTGTPLVTGGSNYFGLPTTLTTNAQDAANSVWGVSNGLTFEGATADGFETTLTVADPTTPSKTITLPDLSGTLTVDQSPTTASYTSAADSITIDADVDNDADGTVLLSTDNSGQTIQLDADSVDLTSNAAINADIGTTVAVDLTPDTVLIDADADNDSDGSIKLTSDNDTQNITVSSAITMNSAGGFTSTVSAGDTTFNSSTGDGDIVLNANTDSDNDGAVKLTVADGINDAGIQGYTDSTSGLRWMWLQPNSASTSAYFYNAYTDSTNYEGFYINTNDSTNATLFSPVTSGTGTDDLDLRLGTAGTGTIQLEAQTDQETGYLNLGGGDDAAKIALGNTGDGASNTGVYVDLTDTVATTVGTLAISTAGDYGGGTFYWGAYTTDATDRGVSHGQTVVSYENTGGTVTCDAANAAAVSELVEGSLTNFTCTGGCAISGTNVLLQITCTVTGITETELTGSGGWVFHYGKSRPSLTWSNDFSGGA